MKNKYQFHKLFQIKQIAIKRMRTKVDIKSNSKE